MSIIEQAKDLFEKGQFIAARDLYRQALTAHGESHETAELVPILRGLGQVFAELGHLNDAVPVLQRALKISEKVNGTSHTETAATLHILGSALFDSGDYKKGMDITGRAFAMRQTLLGSEHVDTLESMRDFSLQKAFVDQVPDELIQKAYEIAERVYGDQHQITAKLLNSVAGQMRPAQAKPLYERALKINRTLKGSEDPYNVVCLSNLARCHTQLGELQKSLELHEQALKLTEKVYGESHFRVAMTLWSMADTQEKQGDTDAARHSLERALIISERALGAEHFITVKSLRDLVTLYGNIMSRHQQEAARQFQATGKVDSMALLTPRKDHMVESLSLTLNACMFALEDTQSTSPMAWLGGKMSKQTAAVKLREMVDKLANDHAQKANKTMNQSELDKAAAVANEGAELFRSGQYDQAEQKLTTALEMQRTLLGLSHLDHIPLLKQMIEVKRRKGEESAVLPLLQQITDLFVQELGPDHPETLLEMVNLQSQTRYDHGQDAGNTVFDQVMDSMEQMVGADNPMVKAIKGVKAFGDLFGVTGKFGAEKGESLSKRREEALQHLPPERLALLEGIDAVDWRSFSHAYGSADDVPRLLALLLSDDRDVVNSVWGDIYSALLHQGDVYDATVQVVPFMLKLLPHVEAKDNVLHFLLDAMGAGENFDDDWDQSGFEDEMKAAAVEVGNGLPILFDMLDEEEETFVALACEVLASLPEHKAVIVPEVERRLKTASDSERREQMEAVLEALRK